MLLIILWSSWYIVKRAFSDTTSVSLVKNAMSSEENKKGKMESVDNLQNQQDPATKQPKKGHVRFGTAEEIPSKDAGVTEPQNNAMETQEQVESGMMEEQEQDSDYEVDEMETEEAQDADAIDPNFKIEPGLLKALISSGKLFPSPLHDAAKEGDAAGLMDILENDEQHNVDESDMFDYNALHIACEHGKKEVVTAVLNYLSQKCNMEERQAVLNAKSKFHSFTPAHSACFYGHLDILKEVIDAGADPYAKTDDGRSLLHLAAFQSLEDSVKYLLSIGLDKREKDKDGDTPVDLASTDFVRKALQDSQQKQTAPPDG